MSKRETYSFELGFFESLHKKMPRDVRVASILAHLYTETGRLTDGLRIDRKLVRLTPDDPTAHYNLACSLALRHRVSEAVCALRTAIVLGYTDFSWMCHDPDLANAHGSCEFRQMLSDFKIS